MNGKTAVARSLCAPIFPIEDLAACIRHAGNGVCAGVLIGKEDRVGEGQHGGRFVAAHQQEYAGHVHSLLAVDLEHQAAGEIGDGKGVGGGFIRYNVGTGIHPRDGDTVGVCCYGECAGIFAHIGVVHAVLIRVDGGVIHSERHIQRRILGQDFIIGHCLRAVILRGESLLGTGSPAPGGTALYALRSTCLLACRGACLRIFRRTRPRALREVRFLLVGSHTNLIGLVGGQIFGVFRFLTAHGQRHVDGGCFSVQVVAEAGVLPLAAVFLIDRHAVAVDIRHLFPFSPHHLIADKIQLGPHGSGRLVAIGVRNGSERLAVDGHKSGHIFALSVLIGDRGGLFRHQERSDVVLAAGRVRTTVGNIDGNAVGVHIDLLIDQVICTAFFLGKIGAQHILCILFGVFDFAGHLIAAGIQCQSQLLKGRDSKALLVGKFQVTRVDGILAILAQPQDRQTVVLAVIHRFLHAVDDRPVDLRVGVNVAVVGDPVDGNVGTTLLNGQGFDLLIGSAVLKGQHDIRRFVRIGIYRDRQNVSTAAGLRIRRIRSQHDSKLLPVLQRDGLHHRLNALAAPVPFRELFDKRPFDGPALLVAEFGLEDLRNEHPHAHAEHGILRLSHRAEVGVDVIKRLLHTLADADVSDRNFRLAAGDELDLRAAEFCSGKGETLRDLYSAVYRAVGADAEIHSILRFVHAAESAQLDRGIQNDHVELRVWQMKLQLLRADEVDALVGRAFILPLLSGELEGVAEAVNDLSVLAKSHNAHIACLERDLAGAEHHIAPALNEL